jgi:hypothetical protein
VRAGVKQASNAVPVVGTAWALDVPLVGTIALITVVTAYVPFFGAIIAGVSCCLIARLRLVAPAAAVAAFLPHTLNTYLSRPPPKASAGSATPVATGDSADGGHAQVATANVARRLRIGGIPQGRS